jgi:hypothetical protein
MQGNHKSSGNKFHFEYNDYDIIMLILKCL